MTQINSIDDLLMAIEAERGRQGLSHRGLCALAGVNRNALYNWKTAGFQPSLSVALKLAKALNLNVTIQ